MLAAEPVHGGVDHQRDSRGDRITALAAASGIYAPAQRLASGCDSDSDACGG